MTDDQNLENDESQPSGLRSQLEEQLAKAAAAEARAAALERKDLFRDAGIDFKNPLHKAVADGYSGDMTEEAVNAFVSGLGLNQPPTADAPPPSAADAPAFERMSEASQAPAVPANPNLPRLQELADQMAQAARRNDNQALDQLSVQYAALQGNSMLDTSLMERQLPSQ